MKTWTGPGEDLRGYVSGALTVESFAGLGDRGVRVACVCECGRVAVRYFADLRSGAASACRLCVESAERAEAARERKRARDRQRGRHIHAGDPGWERELERSKQRRRKQRAADPLFRAREAYAARKYRARRAADPAFVEAERARAREYQRRKRSNAA